MMNRMYEEVTEKTNHQQLEDFFGDALQFYIEKGLVNSKNLAMTGFGENPMKDVLFFPPTQYDKR